MLHEHCDDCPQNMHIYTVTQRQQQMNTIQQLKGTRRLFVVEFTLRVVPKKKNITTTTKNSTEK